MDSTTFPIALDVKCVGQYVPARPSRNETPGEPEHVENFKVFLGDVEITHLLSARDLSELETDFLIYSSGYGEAV